jgi:DNA-binding transcriptional LysR family regulator
MIDAALLPALEDVLMVARAGSVGAAARLLHKTPSAVSQQLRRVQEHFGIRLFERAGRGLRLSTAGDDALLAINRLFDEAEALFAFLSDLAGASITTLRVAASDYLGKALLLPVIRDLSTPKASLRFEISTTHSLDAPRQVLRGEVDLAVVTTLEAHEGLAEKLLFRQPFFWVGPRLRGPRGSAPDRLAREPLLRLAAGSQGRRLLDDFVEQHRLRPASTIDVASVSLLMSYALGGLGVGLVPALALIDQPRAQGVRLWTEMAEVPVLPVKLIWRANYRLTPAAQRFVDQVIAAGRAAGEKMPGPSDDAPAARKRSIRERRPRAT